MKKIILLLFLTIQSNCLSLSENDLIALKKCKYKLNKIEELAEKENALQYLGWLTNLSNAIRNNDMGTFNFLLEFYIKEIKK